MHFAFTEDQKTFAATIDDLLSNECSPAALRLAAASDTGRIPGLWEKLVTMGLVGSTAPESAGGLGFDAVDLVGMMEAAGRHLAPEPLLEHVAVALPTLADGGASEVVKAATAGSDMVAVVHPQAPLALYGTEATWLLAELSGEWRVGKTEGLTLVHQPALDLTRRLFAVNPPPGWGDVLDVESDLVFDRGAVAAAAQAVGIGRRLVEMTVEYVSERHQFGKPVGTYQAVKHHLANAAMAVEFAAPMVTWAAWCVANDAPDRSREVSAAKAMASDAVELAARHALQCHGAIGYTQEHNVQLWLTRGWALASSWGDAAWHRTRIATLLGI